MYAIVPAAGESARMRLTGGSIASANASSDAVTPDGISSKLFIPVLGKVTLLELSLRSLVASNVVSGIVLVARAEDFSVASEVLERIDFKGETLIVPGGDSRMASVFNGLNAIQSEPELVMVHDGARPLCDPALVRAVCEEASKTGAAILGVPIRSTLKRASSTQTIVKTLSRESLWAAQTPQVFQYKLLMSAHEKALKDGFTGTDDSELIEHLGREVKLVLGSQLNIKVTTPEDLHLIRAIVRHADGELYPHLKSILNLG